MRVPVSHCVQVFKALADGQEESVQPKKPKAEAQPRSPYVPKQAKVTGQKRQSQGNQQGPKGKKQKKSGSAEAAVEVDAEEAPPLPPPDSLSAYDSSQTMVEAGMEDDDSLPVPPLPPPSPDSPTVLAAKVNSKNRSPRQAAAGPLLPALEPSSRHSTLPPGAPSAPQGRTQFGFKLQASKRQKLKMTEAEEPTAHAMRERLERHLALQQQQQQQLQQQQQKQQQQQQQQQLPQQVSQLPQGTQLQGKHELQAPAGSLPLPGPPPGPVLPPPGTHQLPYAAMPSAVHAAATEPVNGLPINTRHSRHAQSPSEIEEHRHAFQKQREHPRQHVADASAPLLPGLEPDLHQLPQQLHQAEPELPPGLAPELDQSSQQSPQQLQRRLSHRHVHHRRSRHLHRSDRTDDELPRQHAQPVLLPDDVLPISRSEHQQSGLGLRALPEQLIMHQGMNQSAQQLSAQQLSSQDAQPAYQPSAQLPDQHQAGVQNGPQHGLGDLAESGGPVAVASGLAGAPAEVQVLADDVKSLLR